MFTNYRCPICGQYVLFEKNYFLCRACQNKFDIVHGIPNFGLKENPATHSERESNIEILLQSLDNMQWKQGLEKLLSELPSDNVRADYASTLFRETQASWKYLTKLSHAEHALDLGCGFGTVSLNLCRSFKNVFALDMSLGSLSFAKKMSMASGFANLQVVRGGNTKYLPFPSNFFDLVCVTSSIVHSPTNHSQGLHDSDNNSYREARALINPSLWPDTSLKQKDMLNEIYRILKPDGTMYIATENELSYHNVFGTLFKKARVEHTTMLQHLFARLGTLATFGKTTGMYSHSYPSLNKLLKKCNFHQIDFYSLRPSHHLFYEIIFFDTKYGRYGNHGNIKDKVKEALYRNRFFCPSFGIVASKNENKSNFLQTFLRLIQSERQSQYAVNRFHVTGKGNAILDITDRNNASLGLIAKIPMDNISEKQNIRNYAMLSQIHNDLSIPLEIKRMVPKPFGCHVIQGQNVYVEEKLNGIHAGHIVFDEKVKDMVLTSAFEFILAFHKSSSVKVIWDERHYIDTVGNLIDRVRSVGRNDPVTFEKADKILRAELIGRETVLAHKHGDFSFANIVIDPKKYNLVGIIDWDNSEYGQPFLIDLINVIESVYNFKNFELGYTITHVLLKNNHSRKEKELIKRYLSAFGYSDEIFAPFALLYWLNHIDSQIKYKQLIFNPMWMKENYYNVLSEINKIL